MTKQQAAAGSNRSHATDDLKPVGKVTVQSKIAELERRIEALERAAKSRTITTTTVQHVDLEPEMGSVWKSVEALFAKAFK